jgi:ArsR family transcriptional regulator, lead/cadmium/zinc/bismuth-responsive transcriptional repressor
MKCMSYEKFFEVFANKTRLKIIESLLESEKNVTEIYEDINEEQSNVSHNLKILYECNFITRKREGKNMIYSINKETIKPMLDLVNKHVKKFCKNKCVKKNEANILR